MIMKSKSSLNSNTSVQTEPSHATNLQVHTEWSKRCTDLEKVGPLIAEIPFNDRGRVYTPILFHVSCVVCGVTKEVWHSLLE